MILLLPVLTLASAHPEEEQETGDLIDLPSPSHNGTISVEEALQQRRSIRAFEPDAVPLEAVSQLLWAAQGVTRRSGFRTSPSAGAMFPLEIYLLSGEVDRLDKGVYRYLPESHSLLNTKTGDSRDGLAAAALDQSYISSAPAVLVIAAVYKRTETRYGDRTERYVHMEVGHAAQNVCLQATALELGTVTVSAFHDESVQKVLALPVEHAPLALMPFGREHVVSYV